ncbi:Alpha/Beta hydrolase protein [Exophiala viscosa]|uniref:Alpha/Beta hydrolase protein n=1 Tax=Exophiala viscosa TaxID=2486360 RepID=A0AAN6DWZ4_9EURO|nr:Alpha/Beta hydrolase protein [Exophiala viscosa]
MAPPTKEELDSLAAVDPEIDAIVKSGKFPKLDYSSPDAIHQLRAMEAMFPPPPAIPEVIESNLRFTARDGSELNLFVFSASAPTAKPKALVIFYHGGGGVMGNAYSVAGLARDLVLAHDCVVVSPQYRLAPEHAFPTGVTDALDAFQHVSTKASSFGADVSAGLIIGGVSQGARLAAVIALQAKDSTTTPKITGIYFSAGSFIPSKETVPDKYKESYVSRTDERCLTAPLLGEDMKALFDREYAPDVSSPIHAAFNTQPMSKHAGIAPKVYFQICGMDMLRDDSFIYAAILEDLGVQTRVDVYPGTPHTFWSLFPIKQAQTWKADKTRGVGWLLGRET